MGGEGRSGPAKEGPSSGSGSGLDQALEVRNECRVAIGYGRPTAAFTPNATLRQNRLLQLIKTTSDRRASDAGDLLHGDDPAATRCSRLDSRKMPLATLVELRTKKPPSLPNRFPVDHDLRYNAILAS